mmetsp:Transcript_29526/g.66660  ORF Transcript_29526/g.66660 Transcript_29526/m.66660 type:complete len:232 (-) Transcript_29526:594-1289(-)
MTILGASKRLSSSVSPSFSWPPCASSSILLELFSPAIILANLDEGLSPIGFAGVSPFLSSLSDVKLSRKLELASANCCDKKDWERSDAAAFDRRRCLPCPSPTFLFCWASDEVSALLVSIGACSEGGRSFRRFAFDSSLLLLPFCNSWSLSSSLARSRSTPFGSLLDIDLLLTACGVARSSDSSPLASDSSPLEELPDPLEEPPDPLCEPPLPYDDPFDVADSLSSSSLLL